MCGITGILSRRPLRREEMLALVVPMRDSLRHRGPNDSGEWIDETAGLAFGHTRLSVLDLSEHGHQPMVSDRGRYVLNYNGEIYNFAALRRELELCGYRFAGTSDTEVLANAIEAWGVPETLSRCNGMFAMAVWDRELRTLSLARDRFGEKPLYYGWTGSSFLFGSELKALRRHPGFAGEIDRGSMALFLRRNCVPAPYSIYRGVLKLPPGSLVTIRGTTSPGHLPEPVPYWSLLDVAERGAREPLGGPAESVLDELDVVLREAVSMRMHADVPLGAFLSGGIDSSLVVALMQDQHNAKVRTFTIAFEDAAYSEAPDAARVASHLGSDHLEMKVTHQDALEVVPSMPEVFDEPFSDSSQVPSLLLSKLTREHVTVALSGDGGDELFGGYNRYVWAAGFWGKAQHVPQAARRVAGEVLGSVPPRVWDAAFDKAGRLLPERLRVRMPGLKVQKAASVLPSSDLRDAYRRLTSHFDHPDQVVIGASEPETIIDKPGSWPASGDEILQMMYLDAIAYLPDDILTKVDRSSMSVSLEARAPYLDPNVAELAWKLPLNLRVHDDKGKWALRRLLHRYVPPELVERPKMGFGPPIGSWLRGPLRGWAEELLDERRIRGEGFLDPAPIRRLWSEHVSGRRDRQYELWDVLMLQVWLEKSSGPA